MTFQYSWDFLKAKKKKKKSKAGTKFVRLQDRTGRGGAKLQSLNQYLTDMAKGIYLRDKAPNLGPEIFKRPADVPPLKDGLDRSKPKNQIMIDRHSQATKEYERKMKNYRHFWDQVTKIRSRLRSKYEKNGHDAFMREFKGYAKPASEVGKLTGAESKAARTGRMDALDRQLTSDQMEAEKPVDPIEYLKNRLASKTPESESDVNSLMTGLLSQMGPDALSESEQKELRNVLTQKYNIQPESMADKLKRELNVERRQAEVFRPTTEEMMADLDKLPEDIDFQTGSKALLEGFQPQGMQDINKKAFSLLSLMNPEQRTDDSWGKIRNALAEKYGFDVPEASPAANIAAANLVRNPILPKPSEEKPPVMPPEGQMTLDQFAKPPTRKPPVRVSRPVKEKVKEPAQLAQEQSDRRFDERQARTEQFFAPEPTPAPSDGLTDEQRARIAEAYPKTLSMEGGELVGARSKASQPDVPEPSPSSQGAGSAGVIANIFDQMMDNFRRQEGAGQ